VPILNHALLLSVLLRSPTRHRPLLAAIVAISACGGGPTSPDRGGSIQALLNSTTPDIKVNNVAIQPGATANLTVGSTVAYQVNFTNNSGQVLHYGLLLVRDDGVESLIACGASGSGGGGGGFGTSATVFPNHPIYTRGHAVRVLLIGAFGPNVSGPGQCYLQSSQGVANQANVQAERLLVTFSVQL
jgi:hypothetical protein